MTNELDATLDTLNDKTTINDISNMQDGIIGGRDDACCEACDMQKTCISMKLDLMLGGLGDMSSDIDGIAMDMGEWIPAIDKKLDKILDMLGDALDKK